MATHRQITHVDTHAVGPRCTAALRSHISTPCRNTAEGGGLGPSSTPHASSRLGPPSLAAAPRAAPPGGCRLREGAGGAKEAGAEDPRDQVREAQFEAAWEAAEAAVWRLCAASHGTVKCYQLVACQCGSVGCTTNPTLAGRRRRSWRCGEARC